MDTQTTIKSMAIAVAPPQMRRLVTEMLNDKHKHQLADFCFNQINHLIDNDKFNSYQFSLGLHLAYGLSELDEKRRTDIVDSIVNYLKEDP